MRAIPSARYLLRFDDICPGMNWTVWQEVEQILRAPQVRPLLAVVPDNRDPNLNVCAPDPSFWTRVRHWQAGGWSIGLHGFQHLYTSHSSGILGRNSYSEFAGLPEYEQRAKLESGLAILRAQNVTAQAWIAPAHSFDRTTVRILAELDIDCISDGYSLYPYVCERDLLWVPQQLGRFRWMPCGIWTVCLHINAWTAADLQEFRRHIKRFGPAISSLNDLRLRYRTRHRDWPDEFFFTCFRAARRVRA